MDGYILTNTGDVDTDTFIHLELSRYDAKALMYALMQQMFETDCQTFQATVYGNMEKFNEKDGNEQPTT